MKDLSIKQLTKLIMLQAKEKGFGTRPEEISIPEKIALLHSEISEAYQAYRHKNISGKDGFEEELGDVLQRLLHLCGILDINIEKEVLKKLEANKSRKWDWENMNDLHV